MSFVFPALLSALVLAGVPVLLHLILRKKPKTLPFPAFRFLVARHQTNQRKMQLRHLLLLALRIFLVAALIAAVARPRLLQRNLGLSSERPVAAVLVIDVSASMDARSTDNRSRLDDAKKRAAELLDELPPGSRVAVLSTSESRGDWIGSPSQVRQRLQNYKIDNASPPLSRALIGAFKLLEDASVAQMPRLLCVFSDSTQGSWSTALTPQVLGASDRVSVPRETLLDARSKLAAVTDEDAGSLRETISEVRDMLARLGPADYPLTGRPLELLQQLRSGVRDRLKSPGDEKRDQRLRALLGSLMGYQTLWFDVGLVPPRDLSVLDIEWPVLSSGATQESFRPGEKVLIRPIVSALGQDFQTTLTAGPAKEIREIKKDSQTIVPIEFDPASRKLDPGFHSVEVAVDVRDMLGVNNRRWATFEIRPPRRAIVIVDNPGTHEIDFVRALSIHNIQAEVRTPAQLDAGVAAGTDAVFLFGVKQPGDLLWSALAAFVKAGGGVAILPGGEEMNPAAYNSSAALAVLPGPYIEPVRVGKAGTRWDWQAKGVFRHPFLAPFERWSMDDSIDFIKFPPRVYSFWDVKPASPEMTLVRYQEPGKRPALLERRLGAGKVLQLTTPFDLREPVWNTYLETVHSFYVVATGLLSRHLTGELDVVRANFVLGREEPSVPVRLLAGRGALTLVGPESGPFTFDEKAVRAAVPQATLPGNYKIQDAGKNILAAFSVNFAPEEIDLTPWPSAETEALFGDEVRITADRQASARQLLAGHWSEPVEIFPYIMVFILIVLAVENFLSNRFYRRDEGA